MGFHTHLGLSVLDPQLDGDLEPLPVRGVLGNVISDLLRGQTKGTNLYRIYIRIVVTSRISTR